MCMWERNPLARELAWHVESLPYVHWESVRHLWPTIFGNVRDVGGLKRHEKRKRILPYLRAGKPTNLFVG